VEGGAGPRYFGSGMAWSGYAQRAVEKGLLEAKTGELTKLGRKIGEACKELPDGQAYKYAKDYRRCILRVLRDSGQITES